MCRVLLRRIPRFSEVVNITELFGGKRFRFFLDPIKGGMYMSQISVNDLTFYYAGSFDHVFEHATFSIDTNWRLGFIGRNGRGKTTFLRLLLGDYAYQGSIESAVPFSYFPYPVTPEQMKLPAADFLEALRPGCEMWRVICELSLLGTDAEILYRPFQMLSPGERTRLMLALLFSGENDFLLIDEPTNHLDQDSRDAVRQYLAGKKGFILVSHDRDLLDACIDHVLVLNRKTITVQSGNFSAWQENKQRSDQFAEAENEKHRREIRKLKQAAKRTADWADKSERTKIGFDPVKEHDRSISTRSFIGAKTKKMQSRVRQIEKRIDREIAEKEDLLQDIEQTETLKLSPLTHHRQTLVTLRDYSLRYPDSAPLFAHLDLNVQRGERIALHGKNGCGKSTLLRMLLHHAGQTPAGALPAESGLCEVASGLIISWVPQDTSGLKGMLPAYCEANGLSRTLMYTLLRRLDFARAQFEKPMQDFSEGQKKKVLLAASLARPAHLYIWDEPLNFIDVFSRIQIEELLLSCQPTLLFVEHDVRFRERIATRTLLL